MKCSVRKKQSKSVQEHIFSGIGIFVISLLVTATAVYFYSPVIKTNASTSAEVEVTADVSSVAAVTVDTNNLALNYTTPTQEGIFDSGTVTATVTTNSPGGYELYFSSVDNATDMVNTNPTISDVIASDFNGTVTSTTMASNKWGYSTDDTNYSKIPTSSAHATLRNIDHFPSAAEQQNTVRIGAKVDSTLKAGTYSKSVLFSVIAHEPPVVYGPTTMQGFSCSALTNIGDSTTLTDVRDGNTYMVKKLADGKCWMTQNLRIGGNTAMTLHPSDSDVASDFELPISSQQNKDNETEPLYVYVDDTYGGYYNYYAAAAGTGGPEDLNSGDAPSSICSKGWRLPTSTEFQTLYNTYYNSVDAMMGEPGFVFSGYTYDGSIFSSDYGVVGVYWSSTTVTDVGGVAHYLFLDSSTVHPASEGWKSTLGFAIRCVAR